MRICGLSPGISQAIWETWEPRAWDWQNPQGGKLERLSGHVKLTDKKTETQRGNITYLRSHSKFRGARTGPRLLQEAEALWGLL